MCSSIFKCGYLNGKCIGIKYASFGIRRMIIESRGVFWLFLPIISKRYRRHDLNTISYYASLYRLSTKTCNAWIMNIHARTHHKIVQTSWFCSGIFSHFGVLWWIYRLSWLWVSCSTRFNRLYQRDAATVTDINNKMIPPIRNHDADTHTHTLIRPHFRPFDCGCRPPRHHHLPQIHTVNTHSECCTTRLTNIFSYRSI